MHTNPAPGRDIAERARRLLSDHFTGQTEAQRLACLDEAFRCFEHDPRGGIEPGGGAATFASSCVARLLDFGCTDGHRHALSLLLTHIRETGFGTHPPADYVDLPRILDALCALPSREEEIRYLQTLIEREEEKARLYSPLSAIPRPKPAAAGDPRLSAWKGDQAIALLLHRRRPQHPQSDPSPMDEPPGQAYEDILSAFERVPQAAMLGAPGSGKSTTLRRLAVDCARRALEDPDAPLPILVSLGLWTGDEPLADFIADQVPEIGAAAAALAGQGRLILLLDGLNEVPSTRRKQKVDSIGRFRKELAKELAKAAPCVISCREDDYVGDLRLDLDSLTLEPLEPQRVREVLRHWLSEDGEEGNDTADRLFWQLAGDEGLAGVLETWLAAGIGEDDFWNARDIPEQVRWRRFEQDLLWRAHIPNPRGLVRLAANPFMLTMLYALWVENHGVLPANRGELFAGFVDSLLAREGLIRLDPDTGEVHRDRRVAPLLEDLSTIAWRMQTRRHIGDEQEDVDTDVLTALPRSEILALLRRTGADLDPGPAWDPLKLAEDATLLEGTGEIRFRHQLLQEYFAAVALGRRLDADDQALDALWPSDHWWERTGWEEVAVLLAGLHSDDCTRVIRALADHQPEVAARCVLESGANIAERDALMSDLKAAWMPRLTDTTREPSPEARAAIGRALGRLRLDNRKGLGLTKERLPDIDWVEIKGGEFVYKDGERRTCEGFRIARYPITHAQFQAFLDDRDGHSNDRWWTALTNPDRTPESAGWPIANHPRETVSWHEAMAFCAWLTERLGVGDQGLVVRLPTEWEWERAARGRNGLIYPWGNDYRSGFANIDETWDDAGSHSLAQTTTVGIYPQGASPEGVMDLSGNVWEWCLNEWANPHQTGPAGDESRVVRGGSWFGHLDHARAGYRLYDDPGYRDDNVGFRVLLSSPIL